jgi:hypothetical protein
MILELVMVEAFGALHAMLLGKDMGYNGIIFEGDATHVVNTVNSHMACCNSFGHFVEDIQVVMQLMGMYEFKHLL